MLARATSTARRRWPLLLIGALTLSSILFAGLWLDAASAGPSRSNAAQFSNVKINKFDAIDGGGSGCATFATWGDIPGASKTFKLGGTATRPVLVTVSLQASSPNILAVGKARLLIDDGPQGVGELKLGVDASNDNGNTNPISSPVTYTFLTLALPPGNHTAKLQFSGGIPNGFCVDHWTMAILHS